MRKDFNLKITQKCKILLCMLWLKEFPADRSDFTDFCGDFETLAN